MLQVAYKAVNNIAKPNGLLPTLFIFNIYPCIIIDLPFSLLQ